ncbi:hypothetical protein [Bradyrhizobium sp. ARR65]|uniref:hypothetical protein n=1 Tax=Bradyrhizobium sp. ARR65 TaxID=1040989 RepID=UPI000463CDDB|nr:hypothetical protein [Bradyrhizobium sp. ARR65]
MLHDHVMREVAHRTVSALIFFAAAILTAFGLADIADNELGLSLQIIRKSALFAAVFGARLFAAHVLGSFWQAKIGL